VKILVSMLLMRLLLAPSAFAQKIATLGEIGLLGVQLDPFSQTDHEIGLSEDSLKSFVLEKLAKELSEIEVDPTSNDFIRVRIVSVKVNESSVVSRVSVELDRYVSILRNEDNQPVGDAVATVWGNDAMLVGSAEGIGPKIQAEIEKQLTAFVTEYHRQNPQHSTNAPAGCL
jgi:hypothetical protein